MSVETGGLGVLRECHNSKKRNVCQRTDTVYSFKAEGFLRECREGFRRVIALRCVGRRARGLRLHGVVVNWVLLLDGRAPGTGEPEGEGCEEDRGDGELDRDGGVRG